MKKLLLTIVLLLGIAAQAQQIDFGDYQSLLREDRVWVNYMDNNSDDPAHEFSYTYSYYLSGDTIINGLKYKKCYMHVNDVESAKNTTSCGYLFVWDNSHVIACLREEGNKVFVRPELFDAIPTEDLSYNETTGDYLLYDFGAYELKFNVGETKIADKTCKTYSNKSGVAYIETIGAVDFGTLLVPDWPVATCTTFNMSGLSHVIDKEDNIIYKSKKYHNASSSITDIKQLSLENTSCYYNLQGQAVDIKSAPAGIYIHNGKKVVVK